MKIFAGDSEIKEAEVSRKLGYAGDILEEEDIDRNKNLTWEQFQKLLDLVGDDATQEDLIDNIIEYIDDNAELEGWKDWDDEGHPYSGADQEFSWEWESADGRFFFTVEGKVFGSIDYDPGDYWTPPYSDQELSEVEIESALVSLGRKNIRAFEDLTEDTEFDDTYDMPVELPADAIEKAFKAKHERKRR